MDDVMIEVPKKVLLGLITLGTDPIYSGDNAAEYRKYVFPVISPDEWTVEFTKLTDPYQVRVSMLNRRAMEARSKRDRLSAIIGGTLQLGKEESDKLASKVLELVSDV